MTTRALIVGINYVGTSSELKGCINDALNAEKLLIEKFKFNKNNILILTDDSKFKPTRDNIIGGMRWLLSMEPVSSFSGNRGYGGVSPAGSKLFFHYSGHGSYIIDRNGDEEDGRDETIIPIDYITNGMITDDEIYNILVMKVPSNNSLVAVIDSCHSGTSLDLPYMLKENKGSYVTGICGKSSITPGDVVNISGCTDMQSSTDSYVNGNFCGAMSYSFFEAINQLGPKCKCDELLDRMRKICAPISKQNICISLGRNEYASRLLPL